MGLRKDIIMIWDWIFTIVMYLGSIASIAKFVKAETIGNRIVELFTSVGYFLLGSLTLINIILKIT